MIWPKVNININGKNHEAIAPAIISASRATDIPAFYAKQFIECLKKGFMYWTNPFNGKKSVVSFSKTKFIVFWTKEARPIFPYLGQIEKMGMHYYFNYTINDYDKEGFETNLAPLKQRLASFRKLSERIGPDRVIWRYDPLILTEGQKTEELICKIECIASNLYQHTKKLVFSFVDTSYRKVQRQLKRSGIVLEEIGKEKKSELANGLSAICKTYGLEIASCAEEEDFSSLMIKRNKCIDHNLILKIAPNDRELVIFIEKLKAENKLKDKSQRKLCRCMVSKDIGSYGTCNFNCIYCYAGYNSASGGSGSFVFS